MRQSVFTEITVELHSSIVKIEGKNHACWSSFDATIKQIALLNGNNIIVSHTKMPIFWSTRLCFIVIVSSVVLLFNMVSCFIVVAENGQTGESRLLRSSVSVAMEWFRPVLFFNLIALSGTLSRPTAQGGPQKRAYIAAILPDARRRLSTTHPWPFSIQNVSPAIDVALRRVNNDRIVFNVR